ncbi:MAG TPA: TonB family protein, partial [Candidatus Synoicihabitans sp.]|nr:TonB family protein [Candidatus Synoicihabitans sp.]
MSGDDSQLLRRYAEEGAEDAFGEIVRRHLGLVHAIALRHVGGDAHLARDVAQLVFIDLARKAQSVAQRPVLLGWLLCSARYAAANIVRTEQRRAAREAEAQRMEEITTPETTTASGESLRPLLDDLLSEMPARDRDALLLRFFEQRSYGEIGVRLRLSENAARMRVDRALEKISVRLRRRGITSTAAALGLALPALAQGTAPVGLAASITSAALAVGTSAGAAAAGASGLWAAFMGTKSQIVAAAVVAAAGGSSLAWQAQDNAALRDQIVQVRKVTPASVALALEQQQLEAALAEVEALREVDRALDELRHEVVSVRAQQRAAAEAEARARMAQHAAPAPTVSMAQLDRAPLPRFQARPIYPFEMRRAGAEGEAVVAFVVDASGAVRDLKLVRATDPTFGEAALEAVQRWEFEPGQKGG